MGFSIVSSFQEQAEFAFKVKKYLDDLLEVKTDNFSVKYENSTYFIYYECQGIKVTVPVEFKDVYEYALRKGINNVKIIFDLEDCISHLLQKELASSIV